MANLLNHNVSWNSRDENFLSVGESRGSGSRNMQIQATTQFDAAPLLRRHRHHAAGLRSRGNRNCPPRFTAGDDVVRTGAQQEASETRPRRAASRRRTPARVGERTHPLLSTSVAGLTREHQPLPRLTAHAERGVSSSSATNAGVNWSCRAALVAIGMPRREVEAPSAARARTGTTRSTNVSKVPTRANDGSGDRCRAATSYVRRRLGFGRRHPPDRRAVAHIEGTRALSSTTCRFRPHRLQELRPPTSWR